MKNEKLNEWKPFNKIPGLEVSGSGKVRRNYGKNILFPDIKNLHVKSDEHGRHYIKIKEGIFFVDVLVATCFYHKQLDQNFVEHKDGNIGHDFYYNLQWVDRKTYYSKHRQLVNKTIDGEEYLWYTKNVYISEKGKVLLNDEIASPRECAFDPDIDRTFASRSYVLEGCSTRCYIDDMMATVWGKVIVHKDGDYSNWDDSNIEAVDISTPEAEERNKQFEEWRKKKDAEYEKDAREAWERRINNNLNLT